MSKFGDKVKFLGAAVTYVLKLLFICLVSAIFLEVVLRIIQGTKKPFIPYLITQHTAYLPSNAEFTSTLAGNIRANYVTDDVGARTADTSARTKSREGGVFVVGDSQAMGWGVEFKDTFASYVAGQVSDDPTKAWILASPSTDPEQSLFTIKRYTHSHNEPQKATILVLNLGNDLDEIFLARQQSRTDSSPAWLWLTMKSTLCMDVRILINKATGADYTLTPGVNPILYAMLPDEQLFLADRTVDVMIKAAKVVPRSEYLLMLITPADIQIDPAQFDKYRSYYDQEEFDSWKGKMVEFSNRMQEIEDYLARQLESRGQNVIKASTVIRKNGSLDEIFDAYSHHLTSKGHQLVAQQLVRGITGQP